MNVVAYGGGTNSTAMLVGMYERGIPVDLILFADPGGEQPYTYEYLPIMDDWLARHGMPRLQTVYCTDKNGNRLTLEQECLRSGTLPAIAYGYKKCSLKHKIAPQEKFCNNYPPCREVWARGESGPKTLNVFPPVISQYASFNKPVLDRLAAKGRYVVIVTLSVSLVPCAFHPNQACRPELPQLRLHAPLHHALCLLFERGPRVTALVKRPCVVVKAWERSEYHKPCTIQAQASLTIHGLCGPTPAERIHDPPLPSQPRPLHQERAGQAPALLPSPLLSFGFRFYFYLLYFPLHHLCPA